MSADNRQHFISKNLDNGAELYILKPFSIDDFKNIWQYAKAATKGKQVIENSLPSGEGESLGENITLQDVDSATTSSSNEPKSKRKYCKRQILKEDHTQGRFRVIKKPKMVWTTYLHNMFMVAVKQVGIEKAVPKKILEMMNVPNLTRENVASHLQKYRNFLRKITEKRMVGGLSHRALRSKFASSLPMTVIQDIRTRYDNMIVPRQQYLQRLSYPIGNDHRPFNQQVPMNLVDQQLSSNNSNETTHQLGRGQYPYLHQGLMLQNGYGYGNPLKSTFGSDMLDNNNNNINQNMIGSHANPPYHLANSSYNDGAKFSAYNGGHGFMTSAKCLSGGLNLKYGDPLNQNYGSIRNNHINYGLGKVNMGSMSSSSILPQTNTYQHKIYSSDIQLNVGSQMVETMKDRGVDSVGINVATAYNNSAENTSGKTELPQQKLDDKVVVNEQKFVNAASITEDEAEVHQLEDDLSELFFMQDDMNVLNEMEEIPNASEFSNVSDFSKSNEVVQPLEQSDRASEAIALPPKITSNLSTGCPTSSEQNSHQHCGDGIVNVESQDRFVRGNVSSATSATEQDFDMELIEALFGTVEN